MALSEFEIRKLEKCVGDYVKRTRPSPHLRDRVDLSFRIKNQSVEIFEIRPYWKDPRKKIEESIAKATYVKVSRVWKIYWQRADLKWHRYEPIPEVKTIDAFIKVVEDDKYACFYG